MARTDKHSPANFDPAAYEYVGTVVLAGPTLPSDMPPELFATIITAYREEWDALKARVKAGGFVGNFVEKKTCDHCGAYFVYGAEFSHEDGDVIVVGHICADEAFSENSRRAYDLRRAKGRAKTRRESIAKIAAAEAFVKENSLKDVFSGANLDHESRAGEILRDLEAKLRNWGSLTEKQVAFARKLAIDINTPDTCSFCDARGHREKDCPNLGELFSGLGKPDKKGRSKVVGTVLSTKLVEGDYGDTYKWLVRLDNGAKVWGSIPTPIVDLADDTRDLKGCKVEFTAKVTKKEKSFGFYSRPTKASVFAEDARYAEAVTALTSNLEVAALLGYTFDKYTGNGWNKNDRKRELVYAAKRYMHLIECEDLIEGLIAAEVATLVETLRK